MVGLLLAAFPTSTVAQGFGVFEQGTCTMGRAGATVAQSCDDGSAIYYNPAGLTGAPGWTVSGGATTIFVNGSFTADRTGEETELQNDPIPVPHVYVRYGINERWAAGVGLYVPYGLATQWPRDDFEGSFLGYNNELQSIYVQPTVAYQLTDRVSVGGGLTVVIGSVELNQQLDLSQQTVPGVTGPGGSPITFGQLGIPLHTAFADAKLDAGGATGVGGNFGVQVQATDWLRLGARYTLPVKLNYSGDATFTQVNTGLTLPASNPLDVPAGTPLDNVVAPSFQEGGPLVAQDVETEITMPAQLVAGVSVQATPRLTLLADYQWTQWSVFDEIPLDFEIASDDTQIENYGDTHALRLGAEYQVDPAWTLRAGFITHNAAAPDETVTPLLPEAYRNEFAAGAGWQVSPRFDINVAYQYIAQNDRRGRVRELEEGVPISEINSGLYGFNAHLVATTLTLHF
jgi:long-chain fatty acid transport protein